MDNKIVLTNKDKYANITIFKYINIIIYIITKKLTLQGDDAK